MRIGNKKDSMIILILRKSRGAIQYDINDALDCKRSIKILINLN